MSYQYPQYPSTYMLQPPVPAPPGKGFGIASMVLGLVTLLAAIAALPSIYSSAKDCMAYGSGSGYGLGLPGDSQLIMMLGGLFAIPMVTVAVIIGVFALRRNSFRPGAVTGLVTAGLAFVVPFGMSIPAMPCA